jgi:hypothetical protein
LLTPHPGRLLLESTTRLLLAALSLAGLWWLAAALPRRDLGARWRLLAPPRGSLLDPGTRLALWVGRWLPLAGLAAAGLSARARLPTWTRLSWLPALWLLALPLLVRSVSVVR